MNARRFHERPVRLIHVQLANPQVGAEGEAWRRDEYDVDPRSGSWVATSVPSEPNDRAAVLLELDRDRALLTAPSTTTPIGLNGSGRLPTATMLAAAAVRELHRDRDRLRQCERFLVLADLLATAESPSDVFEALVEHLPRIVSAWKALVLRRVAGSGDSVALGVVGGEGFGLEGIERNGFPDPPFPAVALLDRDVPPEPEDPLAPLGRAVFDRTPAILLACAGIGEEAIAVVADRRTARDFTPQDWDMLRVASRQAAAALDRLG